MVNFQKTFLLKNWIKYWPESLLQQIEVPSSIPLFKNKIQSFDLNVFRDASKIGVSVAVYTIIKKQRAAIRGYLLPRANFQRKIFEYQDLIWLLYIWLPIFWRTQEQLCTDIQSIIAMDGLTPWWFFTDYKISSATNNLYLTKWRKSTRHPLYAGEMSHLKKTLQIWKAGYVNEDHSQTVEKWSKLADRFCRMAKRRRDICHGRESHV